MSDTSNTDSEFSAEHAHSSFHNDSEHQPDSFKTELHPSAGRPAVVSRFEEFSRQAEALGPSSIQPVETPWLPFATRGDFEFAAFAVHARLNEGQVNDLLKLMHRFIAKQDHLTFQSHSQMKAKWAEAEPLVTPVI